MPGHSEGMRQAPSLAVGAASGQPARAHVRPGVVVPSFAEVYEEHFDFVWRSARRLGVLPSSVDDVVQDVFVTVYRRLHEFEGRSQLKTWIFSILRHTVKDMRRTLRRKPTESLLEEPRDASFGPHELALRDQGARLLHEVLLTLEEDPREVFILAELEQLSAPEIASALSVNVNTVYSRLRAARQDFDAALKRLRSRDEWRMR